MRKSSIVFLTLLAVATAAWADDPWKQKSYKDWNENDVRQIMTDSPWAKKVTIAFDVTPNIGPLVSSSSGGGRGAPSGGAGRDPGSPSGTEGDVPVFRGGSLSFIVQWASAMTLRRAAVRLAILHGTVSEADGEKSLAAPVDYHGVAVFGGNLAAFEKLDEAALERVTYLRPRKGKEKLAPKAVEIQHGEGGKTIVGVLFRFPKKLANGEEVVASDEKGVEFVCMAGGVSIRTTFEPQRMVTQEGADL